MSSTEAGGGSKALWIWNSEPSPPPAVYPFRTIPPAQAAYRSSPPPPPTPNHAKTKSPPIFRRSFSLSYRTTQLPPIPNENMGRKELIVRALSDVQTKQSAYMLFKELTDIDSNNKTRGYINEILKCLSRYPIDLISDGFEALLKDRKWSYRMKNKFKEIIYYKEDEDEDTV